jgi:hypothetical protein
MGILWAFLMLVWLAGLVFGLGGVWPHVARLALTADLVVGLMWLVIGSAAWVLAPGAAAPATLTAARHRAIAVAPDAARCPRPLESSRPRLAPGERDAVTEHRSATPKPSARPATPRRGRGRAPRRSMSSRAPRATARAVPGTDPADRSSSTRFHRPR